MKKLKCCTSRAKCVKRRKEKGKRKKEKKIQMWQSILAEEKFLWLKVSKTLKKKTLIK